MKEKVTGNVAIRMESSDKPRQFVDYALVQRREVMVGIDFIDTGIISEEEKSEAVKTGDFKLTRPPIVRLVLPIHTALGLYKALEGQLADVLEQLREQEEN